MEIRRIKVLMAKGWCKVVCFVSFSLLSVICNHASAQKVRVDTIQSVDEALTGKVAGYEILFESGDLAYGPPVRSLMKRMDEETSVSVFAQDNMHHEYVDLGLSVKWATCNIGADKPEDYGDYYAWGELEPKERYTWANYRFRTRGNDEATVRLSKYTSMYYTTMLDADNRYFIADDKTRLDQEDDVAHVRWGGNWRLPTDEEMNELIDSCTWTWTTLNGVNGCLVTSNRPGYTDRSIFLPATGKYGFESENKSAGTWGHYWSSSVNRNKTSYNAGVLAIGSGYAAVKVTFRNHGQPVRPVCP